MNKGQFKNHFHCRDETVEISKHKISGGNKEVKKFKLNDGRIYKSLDGDTQYCQLDCGIFHLE